MRSIKGVYVSLIVSCAVLMMAAIPAVAAPRSVVAYFSVFGNTEEVAGWVADLTGADKFRITPKQPYDPEADLSQSARRDANSRVSIENRDDAARPEIEGTITNIADYDVIFVGHPIWFGKAPKVVRTFLESLDLSGKKVVLFCTSGSSEISDAAEGLRSSLGSAEIIVGKSFRRSTRDDVSTWLKTLGLGFDPKS